MISALEYCHAHLIVHRDLKPENLLLDENLNIKITDFGLSNIMSPGKKFTTFCGSLHYACPEILRGEEYVGPGADIWAMGVILYCLVTGSQPWSASSSEDMLDVILNHGLQIPDWLSQECTDLIVKMLRLREKHRITIASMKTHPWVMKGYSSPPQSYLPSYDGVQEINETVVRQLTDIGFSVGDGERQEILKGEKTQIVSTYHLLVRKYQEEKAELLKKKTSLGPRSLKSTAQEILNHRSRLRSGTVCSESQPDLIETRERSGSEPPQFFEVGCDYMLAEHSTLEEIEEEDESCEKVVPKQNSSKPKPKVPSLKLGKVGKDESHRPFSADHKKIRENGVPTEGRTSPKKKRVITKKGTSSLTTSSSSIGEKSKKPVMKIKDIPKLKSGSETKPRSVKTSTSKKNSSTTVNDLSPVSSDDESKVTGSVNSSMFGCSTTSSLPTKEIRKRVEAVLATFKNIQFKSDKTSNAFKCEYKDTKFELDIVSVAKFNNLRGIKMSRQQGDVWTYKDICEKIVGQLKL